MQTAFKIDKLITPNEVNNFYIKHVINLFMKFLKNIIKKKLKAEIKKFLNQLIGLELIQKFMVGLTGIGRVLK